MACPCSVLIFIASILTSILMIKDMGNLLLSVFLFSSLPYFFFFSSAYGKMKEPESIFSQETGYYDFVLYQYNGIFSLFSPSDIFFTINQKNHCSDVFPLAGRWGGGCRWEARNPFCSMLSIIFCVILCLNKGFFNSSVQSL